MSSMLDMFIRLRAVFFYAIFAAAVEEARRMQCGAQSAARMRDGVLPPRRGQVPPAVQVQPDTILRERHIRALVRDLGVLFLCILPMWSFWIPPHIVLSILFRPFDLNGWRFHRFLDESVCQYRGISYNKEIENPRNIISCTDAQLHDTVVQFF